MSTSAESLRRPSPVVGPGLRRLLALNFLLFALLAANSLYLGAVTFAEYLSGVVYQNGFYLSMFLAHLALGLMLLVPFVLFGILHMRRAIRRPNRYAVRAGLALFVTALVLLLSGIVLTRFGFFEVNDPRIRGLSYWLHVITPFLAIWLFVLHRLAGARIRWRVGFGWAAVAVVFAGAMLAVHTGLHTEPVVSDELAFFPAQSRVEGGGRIPARHLMDDATCTVCHADIALQAEQSMHRLSSFNNPAYRFSIDEARQLLGKRDGDLKVTRLCAACHDLAPLFDGRFTDPGFAPDNDPTAHAGITCIGCHAITRVNAPLGNGAYSIADPPRYPFAFSENTFLKAVNEQLIKAKPAFHKKVFLKPMHRSAEFCSVCHKVHLPAELNRYKWLRGQDHYDSFLMSGVSGHRVDSFYYPARAVTRCAECHMPLVASQDPAARDFSGSGESAVHSHVFAAGNTGVPHMLGMGPEALEQRRDVLEGAARVDLFGLKRGGGIEGPLIAPLRPALPELEPGQDYLLETVVRTLKVGHHLTQGTSDSNELWLDITVKDGDRIFARSGALAADGAVDPWSYFLNAYLLDRNGNRVERRNAQDIYVALYDHQIPPGAASVVHYRLRIPENIQGPLTIKARLQYRKFNTAFMRHAMGKAFTGNDLPIVTLGEDTITLPVRGRGSVEQQDRNLLEWQRWNDYGIGLLREGGQGMGGGSGELRQAEDAFKQVESLGRGDGPLNLARVYFQEGRLQDAADALGRAGAFIPAHQPWTIAWLGAKVDRELGNLDAAISALQAVADTRFTEARERGFDFSYDIRVLNELGRTLYERARQERGQARRANRAALLSHSKDWLERVLVIDPEDVSAHFNLALVHQELGDNAAAQRHRDLHQRYKPDDQAVEVAVPLHRSRNPAADHAAAAIVIYELEPPVDEEALVYGARG